MINPFLRMAMWARRRPSWTRVKLVLAIIAICIAIVLIEKYVGWPEALTLEGGRMRVVK